ncbi:TPA: CBS domain-containing protein [Klebsiella pneumoniae]
MVAADIMNISPFMVTEDTSVLEVVSILLDLQISALLVLNMEGEMTGIITEGNLLRRSELGTEIRHSHWMELLLTSGKLARDYIQNHALYAGDVMTSVPLTVEPQTALIDIIDAMEKYRVKCVPVVREGRVAGVITQVDILKALSSILKYTPTIKVKMDKNNDKLLKESIVEEMSLHSWVPKNSIRIEVRQGGVDIYGTIFSESLRKALITLIEQFVQRQNIRDHLIFYESITNLIITAEENK